jgi:hypothetical protein
VTESRENEVKLRLNDAELARLDDLRGSVPRAAFVRSLLRGDPQDPVVATRAEALSILTGDDRGDPGRGPRPGGSFGRRGPPGYCT